MRGRNRSIFYVRIVAQVLGQLDVPLHGQVARDELNARDGEFAGLDVLAHVVAGDGRERVLDLPEVFAQLAPEDGPVRHCAVLDTCRGLIGGEDDVAHVQLGLDVALELLDVLQVLSVGVED